MIKKISLCLLFFFVAANLSLADDLADQTYLSQISYKNNKLTLVTKKRLVDEKRSYSYTDVDTTSYSYEAYTQSSTDIATQSLNRSEVKEINEWYIYKGGLRQLSDLEFLTLIDDKAELEQVTGLEAKSADARNFGNILIGSGVIVMIGGAGLSASSSIITGGALTMVAGFFVNAFNHSPDHYLQPDYAQQKIDEYNIALKYKLGLSINFE